MMLETLDWFPFVAELYVGSLPRVPECADMSRVPVSIRDISGDVVFSDSHLFIYARQT